MNRIHENLVLDLDKVVYMRTVVLESERENEGEDFQAVISHDPFGHDPFGVVTFGFKSEDFIEDDLLNGPQLHNLAEGLAGKYADRFISVRVTVEGTQAKDHYLIRRDQVVMAKYNRGSELEGADGRLYVLFRDFEGPLYLPVSSYTAGDFLETLTF